MGKIFFRRLELAASIGVLPREKTTKQRIFVDLEFAVDTHRAAKTDAVEDTVDYAKVRESIIATVNARHYQLLETLAETIAAALQRDFNLTDIKLCISKPDIFADMEAVGVELSLGEVEVCDELKSQG